MGTSKLFSFVCALAGRERLNYTYLNGSKDNEAVYESILFNIEEIKGRSSVSTKELADTESDLITVRDRLIDQQSDLTKGMTHSSQGMAKNRMKSLIPGLGNPAAFDRIGHCLSALLAGLIGAFIASRMYQEPQEATDVH